MGSQCAGLVIARRSPCAPEHAMQWVASTHWLWPGVTTARHLGLTTWGGAAVQPFNRCNLCRAKYATVVVLHMPQVRCDNK